MISYRSNISGADYHASDAIGSTQLKRALRSPAHYLHEQLHPTPPTPAMQFGTLAHMAILEADRYRSQCVVQPDFEGKGSRQAKADWLAENKGKYVITEEQRQAIEGMLKAIDAHQIARSLLFKGVAESSFFSEDLETGLPIKARPDFLRDDRFVIDVKTTYNAEPKAFARIAANLHYNLSAAHYLNVINQVTAGGYDKFMILAVETTAPFGVSVFVFDDEAIQQGQKLCQRALRILAECKASGRYFSYAENIHQLALPRYMIED